MSDPLTRERIEELRRIAEAATPGPWEQDAREPLAVRCRWEEPDKNGCLGYEVALASGFGPQHAEDARYIAAFDPPTVLALLDEIECLRTENAHLISDIKFITAPIEVGGGADAYLRYEVDRLRREREALVAAVMAQRERNEHIAECEQCNYELCPVGGELSYRAKRILDAAISLLSDKGGGGE